MTKYKKFIEKNAKNPKRSKNTEREYFSLFLKPNFILGKGVPENTNNNHDEICRILKIVLNPEDDLAGTAVIVLVSKSRSLEKDLSRVPMCRFQKVHSADFKKSVLNNKKRSGKVGKLGRGRSLAPRPGSVAP